RSGSMYGRLKLDGSAEEIAAGDVLFGARFQPRVSPSADGARVAAVFEAPGVAPEVVLLENGEHSQELTTLNTELAEQIPTADWRSYTWASFDGLEIEGLLALPPGGEQTTLPLVVFVHGGPTGTWTWSFPHLWVHMLIQDGYGVFFPNPRGSTGRGQEFARA